MNQFNLYTHIQHEIIKLHFIGCQWRKAHLQQNKSILFIRIIVDGCMLRDSFYDHKKNTKILWKVAYANRVPNIEIFRSVLYTRLFHVFVIHPKPFLPVAHSNYSTLRLRTHTKFIKFSKKFLFQFCSIHFGWN